MSHKIRKDAQNPKLQAQPIQCAVEQFPYISLRYLTTNRHHSLEFLRKMPASDKAATLDGLFARMKEITENSWEKLGSLPRTGDGYETIPMKEVKFRGTDDSSDDQKVIVFRFDTWRGNKCGRILGFKDSPCGALFVIGFDFDYSAYDH